MDRFYSEKYFSDSLCNNLIYYRLQQLNVCYQYKSRLATTFVMSTISETYTIPRLLTNSDTYYSDSGCKNKKSVNSTTIHTTRVMDQCIPYGGVNTDIYVQVEVLQKFSPLSYSDGIVIRFA